MILATLLSLIFTFPFDYLLKSLNEFNETMQMKYFKISENVEVVERNSQSHRMLWVGRDF